MFLGKGAAPKSCTYLLRLKRPEIKHFSRKLQNFLINKFRLIKGLKLSIFSAPKLDVNFLRQGACKPQNHTYKLTLAS